MASLFLKLNLLIPKTHDSLTPRSLLHMWKLRTANICIIHETCAHGEHIGIIP